MEQPANTVHESTSNTAVSHNQPAGCVSPSGSLCGTPSSYGTRTRRISKVHRKNERGETPLHVAARRGEHRQCKKLLQNGALVNAADYAGWTPLHEACSHGNMKAARILINAGADINNACLGTLDTPLHDAVMNGHEKLVWLLLSFGADRERRNGQGKRPLDLCPPESDTLRQLLTSSVVPEHCPSGGESPPSSPLSCQLYHSDTTTTDAPPISSTASSFYDSQSRSELPTDRISPSSSKESPAEADSTLETTPKRKTTDESKETPLCSRRSIWQKDDSYESTTKFDGRTESQAYDVDEGAVREPVSRLGIPSEWEGNEGESRRGGGTMKNRALSTRRDRFTSQPLRRNTLVVGPERRKQRGKRRGRGGASLSTTIPSESQSSATPTTDVYEFRSSPESDVDLTVCCNFVFFV
ncbi:hypothetical protein AB6A40_008755 [Gnathostoma spinigerum]|uniref:Uncharacterized protein n=1 Tax=Gnathostoma spinigerum TaxID=75299 RepID=A0ABD6EX31_9BILA